MKKFLSVAVLLFSVIALTACSNSAKLQAGLDQANKEMPMEVAQGITINKVIDDGNNIVYQATIDDTIYPLDAIEEQKDVLKDNMKSMLAQPDTKELFKIAGELNRGLVYQYKGTTSGDKVEIAFTPEEIRELAK